MIATDTHNVRISLEKSYDFEINVDYSSTPQGLLTLIMQSDIPEPVQLTVCPVGGKSSQILTFSDKGAVNWVNLQDLLVGK